MMDLLRAVTAMEELGIVHGNLGSDKIVLVGEDQRAVVKDFSAACILNDARMGCVQSDVNFITNAFRQAPETVASPSGLSNNIWQLGLVFAPLVLGDDAVPSKQMLEKWGDMVDTMSFEGRYSIKKLIEQHYSLKDLDSFKSLSDDQYGDLKQLLVGMLQKNPKKRISPSEAVDLVKKIAAAEGIALRSSRKPLEFPETLTRV
mmetsp:Transcript_59207/g.171084  ORF Transcript_59207/g.171084 Transcript_59207/m.171084 type:complete len:203 (+) Transcript_59207:83-691(+)